MSRRAACDKANNEEVVIVSSASLPVDSPHTSNLLSSDNVIAFAEGAVLTTQEEVGGGVHHGMVRCSAPKEVMVKDAVQRCMVGRKVNGGK